MSRILGDFRDDCSNARMEGLWRSLERGPGIGDVLAIAQIWNELVADPLFEGREVDPAVGDMRRAQHLCLVLIRSNPSRLLAGLANRGFLGRLGAIHAAARERPLPLVVVVVSVAALQKQRGPIRGD